MFNRRCLVLTFFVCAVLSWFSLVGHHTLWSARSWLARYKGDRFESKPNTVHVMHVDLDEFHWSANLPPSEQYTQLFHTELLDQNSGYSYLSSMAQHGQVDFDVVNGYHLPTKWFSKLDHETLADPTLTDLKTVASASMSSIHVHPTANNRRQLKVGDRLNVRVDLRDVQGRLVQKGGHEVRVWMLSTPRGFDWTSSKAASADVTDLGNGSYTASLPILWPGTTTVVAAMMRPREFRALMLRLLNKMKSLFQITAAFVRDGVAQATFCLSTPVVPGFPKVCNLTSQNNGLPWYCGKPSKPNVSCSDWVKTRSTEFPLQFPLSKTENELFLPYFTRDNTIHRLRETHTFNATDDRNLAVSVSPCSKRRPRDTWNDQSPGGFWDREIWNPLKCSLPLLTTFWIDNCLRDTTVLLLSDSNGRLMQDELKTLWGCTVTKEGNRDKDPIHCVKTSVGARVAWYPHAFPFFTRAWWISRFNKHSPSHYMRAIPSTGRYVVLLHLYAHFLVTHSYIFGLHVQDAAQGVHDLLSRNPSVRVFVRGPHAMAGTEKRVIGDHHGERTHRIFRQEFQPLMDKVVFLDTWDMTVANENKDIHPHHYTNREILRLFLGHLCPP